MPTITIHDIQFDISAPYAPGHPCTGPEAAALNSTRASNLRNIFSKKVKEAAEAGLSPAHVNLLKAEFASLDRIYTFAPPRATDPVLRAAHRIATDLATEELRKKGRARGDLAEGVFESAVARIAASPGVVAEAERRVAATRSIVADALDVEF